jgi:hypothetical protein
MAEVKTDHTVILHTGPNPELQSYLAEQIADAGENMGEDFSTIDEGTEHIYIMVSAFDISDARFRIASALDETYGTTFNLFREWR